MSINTSDENTVTINIATLYEKTKQAKIDMLAEYESNLKKQNLEGKDIILTGPGPIWLYLRIGHLLHGIARSLSYHSPVTGPVTIFNHNPF